VPRFLIEVTVLAGIAVWLSRATGIGYRSYLPLSEVLDKSELQVKKEISRRARRIREQIDELERTLDEKL
jgi:hypothetical protein